MILLHFYSAPSGILFGQLQAEINNHINQYDDAASIKRKDSNMKIHDALQRSALDCRASEKAPKQNSPCFQQVFHEIFDQATKKKPASSPVMHSSSPSPLAVNAIEHLHSTSGAQAMERFINSLDDYRKGLGDPHYNLRDLEPVLERLEKEHRQLSHWADKTPDDSPLKNIITEGLVTATLEISRFRSGVYC